MRVALISQGPSAELFADENPADYDLIIGVNAVPKRFACDWWAFVDYKTWNLRTDLLDEPFLLVGSQVMNSLFGSRTQPRGEVLGRDVLNVEILGPQIEVEKNEGLPCRMAGTKKDIKQGRGSRVLHPATTSGPAALAGAWALGAQWVVCFGVDMDGMRDFQGHEQEKSRRPKRWMKERGVWNRLVGAFEKAGRVVERRCLSSMCGST